MTRTDSLPPLAPVSKSQAHSVSCSVSVEHDSEAESVLSAKAGTKSAPCSPMKAWKSRELSEAADSSSEVHSPVQLSRSDSFHVIHKVPAGDTPYVRAKHVQLVDKDPDRAIALFWAAINSGDRVDSALKDMAIVMKQQNRSEEAIEAIKSLRVRCSDQAQESLDNVLLDLYKRCGRLDDQISLLKHKLLMIHQGTAFKGKRTKTARSQGKKIQVSIEQEATRLLGNLGWAYMQQNNYIAADAVYRKALSIEPDNNKVCNLGICLMKQGRLEEAKKMLLSVTPGGDSRWGSESHLKSYERAQEMLQEVEQQLQGQGKPEPLPDQLQPQTAVDLAAIGIPDLWESVKNPLQQQPPLPLQQKPFHLTKPIPRPAPRPPFPEPSQFLPLMPRPKENYAPSHPPPRHPGYGAESAFFRGEVKVTLEELAQQYNSAAGSSFAGPHRGLGSGFNTPPVEDMGPSSDDSWFLAGRVPGSSFSAPPSELPAQARHDMAWHAHMLRRRLESIQQQDRGGNSSHGGPLWGHYPNFGLLQQQEGGSGSHGLGLSSLRPEAKPFVLSRGNPGDTWQHSEEAWRGGGGGLPWGPATSGALMPLTNIGSHGGEEQRWGADSSGHFSALSLNSSSQKRNRVPTPVKEPRQLLASGNDGSQLPDHLFDFDCMSSVVDCAIGAVRGGGDKTDFGGLSCNNNVTATFEIKRPRKVVLFQDMPPDHGFAA